MPKVQPKLRDVYVIGVGMTPFARHGEKTVVDLGGAAIREALEDAGLPFEAMEAAWCGYVMQGSTAGQKVVGSVGQTGIPVMNVENACASGTTAFRGAYMQVASGIADAAVAIGFEKMGRGALPMPTTPGQKLAAPPKQEAKPAGGEPEKKPVPAFPGLFAALFRAHSERYGTTVEQMAKVGVKNHHNGSLNPRAQYRDEYSVQQVLEAREIADPLTVLMCCPTGSGSAAAILCSEDVARQAGGEAIKILASTLVSDTANPGGDPLHPVIEINTRAAATAYGLAGVKPDDIDVCELHDCFAIAEIVHYENLGFCERGAGGEFIDQGMSAIGGEVAVNPSGGLLAKGHPLGATGVAQVFEIVTQLRGEAGERQVAGAELGLTHCQGFGGATGVHNFAK
jgi:acetyl-CoA acyltransferase